MLLLGFPIFLALPASTLLFFVMEPLSYNIVIQQMISAVNSFPLLAVPFFILVGQIMNEGGITDRIFNFANDLLGHLNGGLGYVNVLASMLFAGMSGSAIADAGGLGLVEIKAMMDYGYDKDFSIGITAASSTAGPIIPPSVPFVIYGAMAGVSVGGLFLGGIIPGILIGLTLFVMTFVFSKIRDLPRTEKASLKEVILSFFSAFLSLLTPVIIIGGIWGGFFTPTEAAFVAIIYSWILTSVILKEIRIKDIPGLLKKTAITTIPAITIVAGASIFGWVMNFTRLDQALINFLLELTTNRTILLLVINGILLFMGMFIEIIAAVMLLLPVLEPLVELLEIHPLHFGVIMVFNLMIGLMTPPVGFVLYVLSSITDTPVDEVFKAVLPWIIPLIITLLLITFIEEIALFIPSLAGML